MGYPREIVERRHGAGRDDVELAADALRLSLRSTVTSEAERFDGLVEELSAQPARLDQA